MVVAEKDTMKEIGIWVLFPDLMGNTIATIHQKPGLSGLIEYGGIGKFFIEGFPGAKESKFKI
jgi:hypothetical protein